MLRRLIDRLRRRPDSDRPTADATPRDYAQERDDQARAQMSDEDRAWAEASRQRDRERRERDEDASHQAGTKQAQGLASGEENVS